MKAKAKPFIKWVGGKTQLIQKIDQALPENFDSLKDLTYIEPFVGGGAVLFWILQQYPNISRAVINDINPDLTNAYRIIKEKPTELINELRVVQAEYL
ncbi:MAG TPA: DNA adenine methylase, partial [Candidatus Marinimicrobia bacterium]|nr:DNA adenine methylase [Candidatus Neomarinimicrobiota bacterium]